MAYRDTLTGEWSGDFSYFTRKQAGIIYRAYKCGNVKMTRKQVNFMYDSVGDTDADTYGLKQAVGFIIDGQFDLAQACIDGREVREVEVVDSITEHLVTQEDAEFAVSHYGWGYDGHETNDWRAQLGMFAELLIGTIYEERVTHTEWAIC